MPEELDLAAIEAAAAQGKAEGEAEAAKQGEAPAPSLSVGDRIADVVDSTNSAIGSAFHETLKAGVHAGATLLGTGEKLTNAVTGGDSNLSGEMQQAYDEFDAHARAGDGSNYTPKTLIGAVDQGATQFLTGMIGAGKFLKGAKFFEGATMAGKAVMAGAAADAIVFDPTQARLSNLFNDLADTHPALRNPLTDFLAAKDSDSEVTGRLKNALEGMVAGAVVEKIIGGVRALRKVMQTHSEKGEAAAKVEWEKQADELEQTQSTQAVEGVENTKADKVPVPESQIKTLEPEVDLPELGIEKAARKQFERANLTGDEFAKLAEDSAVSEAKLAQDILGPELGDTWTKKNLDETWIEKQIDAGRVPGIPPGTPYDQWWKKVEPLFMGEDVRELKKMSRKILDVESSQSAEELGEFLAGHRLYDFMDAVRSQSAGRRLNFDESEAVTIYNTIQRTAAKNGWDLNEVNKGMYSASFAAGYKPKDIADLLGNTAERVSASQGGREVPAIASPEYPTKVTEALTPVDKLGKADDVVDYSKTAQPADPLLSPEAIKDLTASLKGNPDWLVDGFVNTRKAGLNLQKMDSPDGAKLAIEEIAQYLPSPKKVSFAEIKGAAEDMGMKVEDVLASGSVDSGAIAKTLIAGKMLTQSLGRQVSDLARIVERMPERKEELAAAYQRFAHSLEATRSLQSEAARATAAGRIRTFDSFSEAELKAIQAAGGDVSTLVKLVKEPPLWIKLFGAHNQYWINSLLSGPTTHVRNIMSNTLQAIALPAERFIGGLATGDAESMRNAAGLVMGLRGSLMDAMRLSVKASGLPDVAKGIKNGEVLSSLKTTGTSILDPGNAKLSAGGGRALPISTDTFKSLQGTRMGTALDYFGQATNIPSRFLTAEDEFFKQLNYRASVHADAYTEGYARGLRKDALSDYIADRVLKSMDEDGAGLNESAMKYAQQATFTLKPEPGSLTFRLEAAANNHPYLRVILPFIRTPTNILKAAAYRTPGLNLMSKNYRDAFTGKLGERAKADAYGKMMTGGAMIASAVSLTYEGAITGKGPADPREKQILMATGWQPYSFKVNGQYIPYNGFDPAAMFYGVVADYAEARGHMNEEDNASVAGALLMSLANNMTSKSYLIGLSQSMDALVQPGKSGENFIKSRAASYVPSGLKQVAGLVPGLQDPYMRETRSIMDAIQNKIPGLSQTLPPRRNIFGEAVTSRTAFGPDSISPFYYSEQKDDPASNELARFAHSFVPPSETYKGINLTQVKNEKGQDFYDRWQETLSTLKVGRYNLKDRLEHLVTSEPYKRWRENEPDAIGTHMEPRTLKEVRAVIETFRQQAFRKTLQEYPEVSVQLRAAQKAQTRASAGAEIPDVLQQLLNPK